MERLGRQRTRKEIRKRTGENFFEKKFSPNPFPKTSDCAGYTCCPQFFTKGNRGVAFENATPLRASPCLLRQPFLPQGAKKRGISPQIPSEFPYFAAFKCFKIWGLPASLEFITKLAGSPPETAFFPAHLFCGKQLTFAPDVI